MTARQKALAAEDDKVQGAPKIKKWTARQKALVAKIGKMQKVHRDNKLNYIPKVKKRNCIFHCAKVYAMLT